MQSQVVKGSGFSFQAPVGWQIAHSASGTAASRDSELVQVATFPLVHPYTSALFDRVAGELTVRMKAVVQETG